MTISRDLRNKKYQVVLNDHLTAEILDQMHIVSTRRAVIVRGLGSIRVAIYRAARSHLGDYEYGRTLTRVSKSWGHRKNFTLAELLRILADDRAIEDVKANGYHFPPPVFGKATCQAVREFADAALVAVDHGLFRP